MLSLEDLSVLVIYPHSKLQEHLLGKTDGDNLKRVLSTGYEVPNQLYNRMFYRGARTCDCITNRQGTQLNLWIFLWIPADICMQDSLAFPSRNSQFMTLRGRGQRQLLNDLQPEHPRGHSNPNVIARFPRSEKMPSGLWPISLGFASPTPDKWKTMPEDHN